MIKDSFPVKLLPPKFGGKDAQQFNSDNCYAILGVDRKSKPKEILQAYLALTKKWTKKPEDVHDDTTEDETDGNSANGEEVLQR